MKLTRFILSFGSLCLMVGIVPFAHASSIVSNGTFAAGLTGWTPNGSGTTPGQGIQVINFGPNATQYGDNIPDIGGTSTGVYFVDDNASETLSQSISLAANTSYQLSFDLFETESGAGNEFNFTLADSVGSVASSSFGNANLVAGVWTPETLDFTTDTGGSYVLLFDYTSGQTPAKDVVLTNVAVSATPEPGSFLLLGTGLLGAAAFARRRFSF